MRIKSYIFILVLCSLLFAPKTYAGDTVHYTLQACRDIALTAGTSAKSQEELQLAAKYNRQAALAAMFPRITANGGYMWNSKKAHLIADNATLPFGTTTVGADGTASFAWNPESNLSQLITDVEGTALEQPLRDFQTSAGQSIADAYKIVYDKLTLDLTHIVVAQVGITQPIYTGGRLSQLYKIAKASENIANIESDAKRDEIIYAVDEAYWRIVSVRRKKELTEQYHRLLCQLESDVKEAVAQGLATQSDVLQVMTKRGDAEVKCLQAENGLTLSNMALAQLCGLPLSTVFVLDESELNNTSLPVDAGDAETAVANRSEIQLLEQAQKIAKSNAMLAAAGLQPNIVASASYIYTNPNAENGVSNNWDGKGYFSAGVVVNVPIVHADDILRYKAAKHAANAVALKTEETRELLTLQITQANQRLMEAQQKITLARLTQDNAAEVMRMAEESFGAGLITASELMQAQTAWLAASTDVIDAEIEAKTTETQLRKYTGKLR
ncbi:MAG: TolC family protein [Paludibacteraceae bacterium]|nr:TolC family protein [Paludibacteraceae bacterium]